jgi:hypothetical protein
MGLVSAESNTRTETTNEYNQTSSSCSQDDITAAKQGLADLQKKNS